MSLSQTLLVKLVLVECVNVSVHSESSYCSLGYVCTGRGFGSISLF